MNIDESLAICMMQCISKVECMSFSYKTSGNECVGIGVGYIERSTNVGSTNVGSTNVGSTSFGLIYFLVLDGKY